MITADKHPFAAVLTHPLVGALVRFREVTSLIFVVGVFAVRPFLLPSLIVHYQLLSLTPPSQLQSIPPDSMVALSNSDHRTAYAVAASPELMIVDIFNSSNESIDDLELSFWNASVLATAMRSSSFRMGTALDSLASVRVQDGVTHMPNLRHIPPQGSLRLYLWGRVSPGSYLEPAIRVDADIRHIRLRPASSVAGFRRFVADNVGFLLFILVVISLLLGLRRVARSRVVA